VNRARRWFLEGLVGAAATCLAPVVVTGRPGRAHAARRGVGDVPPGIGQRLVIVNADDLGMAEEVDAGILEAHDRGIVTSASLMVYGAHAAAAVAAVRSRPRLSVGLHVVLADRGRWLVNARDLRAVRRELNRQLEAFVALAGRLPTHIDSHHHHHRLFNVARLFLEAGDRHGIPVRGLSDVQFLGSFYGQPQLGQTDLSRISVEAMVALLRSVEPGTTEISCHPGHPQHEADAVYNTEREVELRALVDARLKAVIDEEGLMLISYAAYRPAPEGAGRGDARCGRP
jgi:predicted glycoside hydrolase/deacetylase ChbG (UPF0249 family)